MTKRRGAQRVSPASVGAAGGHEKTEYCPCPFHERYGNSIFLLREALLLLEEAENRVGCHGDCGGTRDYVYCRKCKLYFRAVGKLRSEISKDIWRRNEQDHDQDAPMR
jgi:hypothetical protein